MCPDVMDRPDWYRLKSPASLATPALLVYPERIKANIASMISIAGGSDRLQPHVKTHKMAEVVRLKMEAGITRFKCATIAEVEMVAACGAGEALLANQPVGPQAERLAAVAERYPDTRLGACVDDLTVAGRLSRVFGGGGKTVDLYVDLDVGMERTGIAVGDRALELYETLRRLPAVAAVGWHVYDGHLGGLDSAGRKEAFTAYSAGVDALIERTKDSEGRLPPFVAGGSPSFELHAGRGWGRVSPGTAVFWDSQYARAFPELPFVYAALVATRVLSCPGSGRLCLDLGYKAVSAEAEPPHASLFELPGYRQVLQNEEHLVVEHPEASNFQPGDLLMGVPRHICPTVALYDEALVVEDGGIADRWRVTARGRRISV